MKPSEEDVLNEKVSTFCCFLEIARIIISTFIFFKRLTSFLSKFLSFKCCILVLISKVLPTADVFVVMGLFCCSGILLLQEPSSAGDGEKGGWFHLC